MQIPPRLLELCPCWDLGSQHWPRSPGSCRMGFIYPKPPQESGQGGNSTHTPHTGGDEGQKRLLCLWVPQNLIPKKQLGGKPSSVAGTGLGSHSNISPAYDLCQLLGGLQNLPATLQHKERDIRDSPQIPVHGWGTGIWGLAGMEGKAWDMWYLLIHLLLQVGEGHPQQVQRPASVPAQGIRELQGHSKDSPS